MEITQIIFAIVMAIIGSFMGFYITRFLEKRHLPKITKARQKAINGKWEGTYKQDANKHREEKALKIEFILEALPRKIIGKMIVEDEKKYTFSIEGPFYHNKYLRLNYTASNETEFAIDFGSIFLVLGDYPDTMDGKIAGYGSMSRALISGNVSIKKNA